MSDLLDAVVAAAGLTVFGAAPAQGALGSAAPMPAPLPGPELAERIAALRSALRARGLDRVVLCATGTPAAAAAAIARTLGQPLTVLDAADPHAARAALADRLERTVVVLAAPGAAGPDTDAYHRAFRQAFEDAGVPDPGRLFVVVTAPGSPLAAIARETGAELLPAPEVLPSCAAPALSAFGLVAAGLAGADVGELLAEAAALSAPAADPLAPRPAGFALTPPAPRSPAAGESDVPASAAPAPGPALGAAIARAAREGRDKLAIAPDGSGFDGLGECIERLFAAAAPGLVPVLLENPSSWGHEGPDVLSVTIGGALAAGSMPGGGIVPDLSVNGPLGAQLLAWQQAAAVAGHDGRRGPDAAGDPGHAVAQRGDAEHGDAEDEGAARALRMLDQGLPAEAPALVEGAIEVYGETGATTLIGAIDELARGVPPGGHLAVAAHLDRAGDAAAAGVRDALAGRVARAVTFGWGSRPVHPGPGAHLQITGAATGDVPVPGRPYTFGELQAARAAGDRHALLARGRPLLRLHLTDRATGIEQLLAALGG